MSILMGMLKRVVSVLAVLVLGLGVLVGCDPGGTVSHPSLPALVQSGVAASLKQDCCVLWNESVDLTNVHAGDVLLAWGFMSTAGDPNLVDGMSVSDSESLGWHSALIGGTSYEFPPQPLTAGDDGSYMMWWANVPRDIPALNVSLDLAGSEPGASLIVSEWTGVVPLRSRYPNSPTVCDGAGGNIPSSTVAVCPVPGTLAAPAVRVFCVAVLPPSPLVSNGLSDWATVASTDVFPARCIYRVASGPKVALDPMVDVGTSRPRAVILVNLLAL
jgi:hypothetical protein